MKRLTIFALLLLMTPNAMTQIPGASPKPGVKRTVTLTPSYSCRSAADFSQGYQNTALFLSASMKYLNSPDLLFNGACGSEDYFQSSTHGDNRSLVADLASGSVTPEILAINSSKAQLDARALDKLGFKQDAMVVPGHTYAALLDKHGVRALFVFTVNDYVKNTLVSISYEVLDYRIAPEEPKRSRAGGTKTD
jgi:hypothetical protein